MPCNVQHEGASVKGSDRVELVDLSGKIQYSGVLVSGLNKLSVSGYSSAVYLLRVYTEKGVQVRKVVIQRN